jgi:predicted alpha/beta-fold hydrolase
MSRKITISMDEHYLTIDAKINNKEVHKTFDRTKDSIDTISTMDEVFNSINKHSVELLFGLNIEALARYIDNHCTQITFPNDIPNECKEELKKILHMDEFDDKNNIITFNSYRMHGNDSKAKYWYQLDYNELWKSIHDILDKYNIKNYKFRELN